MANLLIFILLVSLIGCTAKTDLEDTAANSGSTNLGSCSADTLLAADCKATANQIVTSTLGSHITSFTNAQASTTVTAAIPDGFYLSQTCSFTENNLLAANIKSGISIFGVTGTFTGLEPSYRSTMTSTQHRSKNTTQTTLEEETVSSAGMAYSNSSAGYRAVPDITKDDEGFAGTSNTAVNRTGWGINTCGTTQSSIAARIADCAANPAMGAEATWNGSSKGNAGQGQWKLVTRSGDFSSGKGREVWQDQRTGLLWSSIVSTGINWCQASGNNNISNNPTAQADPNSICDDALNQSTGAGPATKAISACFEDGENYFTNNDPAIDNAGKAGLSLISTPAVAWRLPTVYDYHVAEANGLRFVLPDALANGYSEWSATTASDNRGNAWVFLSWYGNVASTFRGANSAVRCVGR